MSKRSLRYSSEADMPESMRRLLRADPSSVAPGGRGAGKTTASQIAGAEKALQRHAAHQPGVMNKTEARYDQHLRARHAAGEVRWWVFERLKLRLAAGTFFTVDFLVQLASGALECHEVKGRKGNGYWAEEDAKIKIKVAADQFPVFGFVIVWPAKGGGWCGARVP